jgi:hypothetical protein
MDRKIAIFAFTGDPVCFVHVLLNALDLAEKGYQTVIVIEGTATKLIPEMASGESPLSKLYEQVKDRRLISGVCRACSKAMGVLDAVKSENLPIADDMAGHAGMAKYVLEGFTIVTL